MRQYVKNVNRLIDCVEARCQYLRRAATATDLVTQLSLRSLVMAKSTVSVEITSLRMILDAVEATPAGIIWPAGLSERDWLMQLTHNDLDGLRLMARRPQAELVEEGPSILEAELDAVQDLVAQDGPEHATRMITGKREIDLHRTSQKDQRFLTKRDLTILDLELSIHDPMTSLEGLRIPGKPANIEGLLRLFITVMWHSGMRPTEVWDSALMVPKTDIPFSDEMRDIIRRNPSRALTEGWMERAENVAVQMRERNLGLAAHNAIKLADAPAILMIRSAKQTNANSAKSPLRLQVLDGIPQDQLSIIALTSFARRLNITDERKDNLRSAMGRALKRVGARHPALSNLNLNLYAFRHSFASRVKMRYEAHEAAALTGHTGRTSLHHYGERNLRKSTGRRMTEEWLPSPDPVRAEEIRMQWQAGPKLEAEAAPRM